jgi:hypothetical protein
MNTDWQTLMTVVPTALSASLYSMTQLTFEAAMARRRAGRDLPVIPWVSVLKPLAGVDDVAFCAEPAEPGLVARAHMGWSVLVAAAAPRPRRARARGGRAAPGGGDALVLGGRVREPEGGVEGKRILAGEGVGAFSCDQAGTRRERVST